MNFPVRIRKLLSKPMRSARLSLIKRVEGVPENVNYGVLAELCNKHTGKLLRKVSYIHLSGWKQEGAFRLYLENDKSEEWTLIYKNAIYDFMNIPALKGFPIMPGPSEYQVYRHSTGALRSYLPEVYLCKECVPGKHYQYFLEDLGGEYQLLGESLNKAVKCGVVAAMPDFHHAMREWLVEIEPGSLVQYDHQFALALLDYANHILPEFSDYVESSVVDEVCRLWPKIYDLYSEESQRLERGSPIHGDANAANILVHRKDPTKIKVIDWEWAGLGMAFADVASLYRGRDFDSMSKIIDGYIEQGHLSQPQALVKRQFECCQFERGLLNAVYIAAQHLSSNCKVNRKQACASKFIEKSLNSVLCHYRERV